MRDIAFTKKGRFRLGRRAGDGGLPSQPTTSNLGCSLLLTSVCLRATRRRPAHKKDADDDDGAHHRRGYTHGASWDRDFQRSRRG